LMNYNVILGRYFKLSVKKLEKRFPSVKKDVRLAVEVLLENPELGVLIPDSSGVRKLRLRNSDMKRGKSGGYRLLYLFDETAESISFLLLYAKSDRENITQHEIQQLLNRLSENE